MILSNQDLHELMTPTDGSRPVVSDFDGSINPFAHDSIFEACSIRLTVGNIFTSESKLDEIFGTKSNEMVEHEDVGILPGGIVFVVTQEKISLGPKHAGIMTSKSSGLAERGVLITNTGQVDPGYSGQLRYAVINMGAEKFFLKKGDSITKLMIFELKTCAQPDWSENKNHSMPSEPSSKILSSLGREVFNFRNVMSNISNKEITKYLLKWGLPSMGVSILLAIFSGVAAAFLNSIK